VDVQIGSSRGGAVITVRVRPRSRPGIAFDGSGLVIRVAAPPVEGRATEEARKILAGALGVPPSTILIRAGERSRTKVFVIGGLEPEQVRRRLSGIPNDGPGSM
jgi:uncharacterized protein